MKRFIRIACFSSVFLCGSWQLMGQAGPDGQIHDFDTPEAWAMKYFGAVSLMTGYGPMPIREPGWVDLSFEVIQIPHLSKGYRTVGFGGIKEENLNNGPIVARPKLTYYVHDNFSITMSYIPPIEAWDVKATVFTGSFNWAVEGPGDWMFGLRGYVQKGKAQGPFTCDHGQNAGNAFSTANPFGCTGASSDIAYIDYYGVELTASHPLDCVEGLTPFVGIGYTRMDLKFEMHTSLFLAPHRRTENTSGWVTSFTTGLNYEVSKKVNVGIQLFYAPLYVKRISDRRGGALSSKQDDSLINIRAQVSYAFGNVRDIFD